MLKPLSLKDMSEFYMKYIHPSSETRAKLSIQAYSRRIHIGVIDKLVETMEEHKIDSEPIKKFVKDEQPLSKLLKEAVAKHVKENAPGLHRCCKEEILREVDILSEYPDFEKELPGSKVIGGRDLKYSLAIGEPRKPVGNYYDGVAKL